MKATTTIGRNEVSPDIKVCLSRLARIKEYGKRGKEKV